MGMLLRRHYEQWARDEEARRASEIAAAVEAETSAAQAVTVETTPADSVDAEPLPDPVPADCLPPGHVRPSLEEFVAAGYSAETYERHMRVWEHELADQLTAPKEEDPPAAEVPTQPETETPPEAPAPAEAPATPAPETDAASLLATATGSDDKRSKNKRR